MDQKEPDFPPPIDLRHLTVRILPRHEIGAPQQAAGRVYISNHTGQPLEPVETAAIYQLLERAFHERGADILFAAPQSLHKDGSKPVSEYRDFTCEAPPLLFKSEELAEYGTRVLYTARRNMYDNWSIPLDIPGAALFTANRIERGTPPLKLPVAADHGMLKAEPVDAAFSDVDLAAQLSQNSPHLLTQPDNTMQNSIDLYNHPQHGPLTVYVLQNTLDPARVTLTVREPYGAAELDDIAEYLTQSLLGSHHLLMQAQISEASPTRCTLTAQHAAHLPHGVLYHAVISALQAGKSQNPPFGDSSLGYSVRAHMQGEESSWTPPPYFSGADDDEPHTTVQEGSDIRASGRSVYYTSIERAMRSFMEKHLRQEGVSQADCNAIAFSATQHFLNVLQNEQPIARVPAEPDISLHTAVTDAFLNHAEKFKGGADRASYLAYELVAALCDEFKGKTVMRTGLGDNHARFQAGMEI